MYAVSSRFLEAVRGPYRAKTVCDIYFQGALVVADIPVESGSISIDRTASIRRQGSLTLADKSFVPSFVTSTVAPYGAQLSIRQGVTFADGSDELVPLGMFRIQAVTWDESVSGGQLPSIDFFDRSKIAQDAQFLTPIDRSGWSAITLLTDLITDAVSGASVTFDPGLADATLPGGTVFELDRWAAVQSCAAALGGECYADAQGDFVVAAIPAIDGTTTAADAVWTVDAGEGGVLVSAKRGVTRDGVYNAVVAMGVDSGEVVAPIGYAFDLDPSSPTYWGPALDGTNNNTPFGMSVYRYTNNLLTTTGACTTAATGQLRNFLGLAKSLTFTACPNPALEAGDIINVAYSDGTSELHLIDTLRVALGATGGGIQATTRTFHSNLTPGP